MIDKSEWVKKPFTEDDYRDIKERLNKGQTQREIAAHYQISRSTLSSRLNKRGIKPPPSVIKKRNQSRNKIKVDRETLRLMKELYESGHSYTQIGKKVFMSTPTVSRILKEAGVPKRAHGEQMAEVMRVPISLPILHHYYVECGMTQNEVAEKVGRHRNTVRRELKRYGLLDKRKPKTKELNRDLLMKYYIEERRSKIEVAKLLNTSDHTVKRELERYGIGGDLRKYNGGHLR